MVWTYNVSDNVILFAVLHANSACDVLDRETFGRSCSGSWILFLRNVGIFCYSEALY